VIDGVTLCAVRALKVLEDIVIYLDAVGLLSRCRAEVGERGERLPILTLGLIEEFAGGARREPGELIAALAIGAITIVVIARVGGCVGQREDAAARRVGAEKQVIAKVRVCVRIANHVLADHGVVIDEQAGGLG